MRFFIDKTLYLFLYVFLCFSCKGKYKEEMCALSISNKYVCFQIDEDVRLSQRSVFLFSDNDSDYLTFQHENKILIYNISSKDVLKSLVLDVEGDNGITGGFLGYNIIDFNNIYISSMYISQMFVVDTTGVVKRKIKYPETDDGEIVLPCYFKPGIQMCIIDSTLYLPQPINPMHQNDMIEKSPISVILDMKNGSIKALPMRFPPLINISDIGTSAGLGANYSRCYDGKHFIYSFNNSDVLYKTSLSHDKVQEKRVCSKYVDKVGVLRIASTDGNEVMKSTCEHPSYGDIVYDKYRNVYYQFVYPKTEIEPENNPFDIYFSGRKVFSIMVLDENLESIGETLFPEYAYNSNLYFVLEDGLYLSTNHIKNPGYSDDLLTFQRIDLVDL